MSDRFDACSSLGHFPESRPRRLRAGETLRRAVRETRLSRDQFVMPYFVREGRGVREPIASMPGQHRFSIDTLLAELEDLTAKKINAVLLFGLPDRKDENGSQAWSPKGVVQSAVREIKKRFKDLLVITDVCLCEYTSHGHCGLVTEAGAIDNDRSLILLADTALSHAEAGADIVAPSDMMDGRVQAIRKKLDQSGMENIPILSYAAKYASAFYGPFREAAHCAPQSSLKLSSGREIPVPADRKTYQMDPANFNEALREIASDIREGADMVMVKPALAYLDIIREAARRFACPVAAYCVSGEYAMIKAAAEKGYLDERAVVVEMMTSVARAGASLLFTYHAKEISTWDEAFR
jgi:porphobilinogen synthase